MLGTRALKRWLEAQGEGDTRVKAGKPSRMITQETGCLGGENGERGVRQISFSLYILLYLLFCLLRGLSLHRRIVFLVSDQLTALTGMFTLQLR